MRSATNESNTDQGQQQTINGNKNGSIAGGKCTNKPADNKQTYRGPGVSMGYQRVTALEVKATERIIKAMKRQAERLTMGGIDPGIVAAAQFSMALEYSIERDGSKAVAEWLQELAQDIRKAGSTTVIISSGGRLTPTGEQP